MNSTSVQNLAALYERFEGSKKVGPMGDKPTAEPDPVATAHDFETLLVQQMVAGMRNTADLMGEGGMFGDGPGAETYGEWFDKQLASQVTASSEMGVVDAVMADLARWKQVPSGSLQTGGAQPTESPL